MSTQHGERVVVGVDGSEEATTAVRWAGAEAARRHASLRLVRVIGWADDHVAVRRPGGHHWEKLLGEAQADLAAAAAAARSGQPAVTVEQDAVGGNPVDVLIDESRRAQLVVIGDRGLGRVASLTSGTVVAPLATHASCPVVVVRGTRSPEQAGLPVVVGVDGTPTSEAAVTFAFEAASARSVPLIAVHSRPGAVAEASCAPDRDLLGVSAEHDEALAEVMTGWTRMYPDVPVERVADRGDAATLLLELSASAQLVVVGCRGHTELAGIVLGSVSNVLVHGAACPVAVVRPAAPAQRSRSGRHDQQG